MSLEREQGFQMSAEKVFAIADTCFLIDWSSWRRRDLLQNPPLDPLSLISYAVLGIISGIFAILYVKVFYGIKNFFSKLSLPNHFKPAIGGLLVGLIALFVPQSTGMGYGWIQLAIWGRISPEIMLIIALTKIFATGFTIGSREAVESLLPRL